MRRLLFAAFAVVVVLAGCSKDEADLAVGVVTVVPKNPQPGNTVTVTLPVRNDGAADAEGCSWTVNRDGVRGFANGTLPALGQGASGTVSFPVTESDAGSHTYLIIVNSDNVFSESNLGNNSTTVLLTYSLPIDLQLAALTFAPAAPTTITPITLTAAVTNAASAPGTAANIRWRIRRDGIDSYAAGVVPTLAPGATDTISVALPLQTAGSHTYELTIDPDGFSTDTDLTNNVQTLTVVVAPISG